MFAAVTAAVVVTAVSNVNVGRNDPEPNPTIATPATSSAKAVADDNHAMAFKGYELAGKHLKLFTDRIEQDVTVEVTAIERNVID